MVLPLYELVPLKMTTPLPLPLTVKLVAVLLPLIGPEKVRLLPRATLTAKLLPRLIGAAMV